MSCFVTALSGTLGKSLSNPFRRCLVVSCRRGSCREAGSEAGEPGDLPACAPRNFGPRRGAGTLCGSTVARLSLLRRHPVPQALPHSRPRESDFGAVRVAGSTGVAQRRGPCTRGSQLHGRSAWPRRQARSTGWPRATPLPPATFAFPRGKLAPRVPVAVGPGRHDPGLTGSRLLDRGAHGSLGGGEDGRATAASAQQMPPLCSPTQ